MPSDDLSRIGRRDWPMEPAACTSRPIKWKFFESVWVRGVVSAFEAAGKTCVRCQRPGTVASDCARRLSHCYVMDVPGHRTPLIVTDAAVNIAPNARGEA